MIEVDKDFMYHVSQLKANHSITLGDCFAAALAVKHSCSIVTGDREFEKLGNLVSLEWLT